MRIFFSNPILGRIEEALWERVGDEVAKRIKKGELKPGKRRRQSKVLFKSLWSVERKKAKIALPVYKQIGPAKTKEAIIQTFAASESVWYSVEEASVTRRVVIGAVPLSVFSSHVACVLDALLQERIEFANLAPEARGAFARHSADTHVESMLKDAIKDETKFESKAFDPYKMTVADIVSRDHYYLGKDDNVSRIDMVVVAKDDRERWKEICKDINARDNQRRFTSDARTCWSTM